MIIDCLDIWSGGSLVISYSGIGDFELLECRSSIPYDKVTVKQEDLAKMLMLSGNDGILLCRLKHGHIRLKSWGSFFDFGVRGNYGGAYNRLGVVFTFNMGVSVQNMTALCLLQDKKFKDSFLKHIYLYNKSSDIVVSAYEEMV